MTLGLATQQRSESYRPVRFSSSSAVASLTAVSSLRESVVFFVEPRLGQSARIRSSFDVGFGDLDEVIDVLRAPLALRRIRGETLSAAENALLDLLNQLRRSEHEHGYTEPIDVAQAVQEAQQILARARHAKSSA